jgi:hypothetical protein
MIEFKEIWRTQNAGASQLQIIDFNCEYCGNKYSEDSINLAVFLYGLFCLQNKSTSFLGLTCPSCLKTIVIKESQSQSAIFKRVSSLINFGGSSFEPKIEYINTIYNQNLFGKHVRELRQLGVKYFHSGMDEQIRQHISSMISTYVAENNLEDHLCSINDATIPSACIELFILFVNEEHLEDLVRFEEEKNIRIIPRYMHRQNIYNQIELFCSHYGFGCDLDKLVDIAQSNLQDLKRIADGNNWNLDEILSEDCTILHPGVLAGFRGSAIESGVFDFSAISNYMNILAADPPPWDFPAKNMDWIKEFWSQPFSFKDQGVPTSLERLRGNYKTSNLREKHKIMVDEVIPVFPKDYVHKLLSFQYPVFISEYSQAVTRYAFSYADIWKLKERHLENIYKCVRAKKATRPTFQHREKCRQVAVDIWAKNPDITIADMCYRNEIALVCDDITYPEATLRKWIKDLCPNRKPGRRPKKRSN